MSRATDGLNSPLSAPLRAAFARLDARIDWERRDRGAMRQDLGPMWDLTGRLGHPERDVRAVHVAGSKGKGSVAALVAAGLSGAGLRTGLYTSPHVESVRERVTLDGRPIGDELLARALEEALAACEAAAGEGAPAAAATWFDLLTAAALLAFSRAGAQWAAIEVGLGGRLDSTNVVRGEVVVITGIELEHTELLGTTRAAIAAEKAGILKPGARLVHGLEEGDEAGAAILVRARELGLEVVRVETGGGIAADNRALAGAVLDALGGLGVRGAGDLPLSAAALEASGVAAAARLPGRLERFRVGGVQVVLDGAHTPGSVAALLRELGEDPTLAGPAVAVLGLARDKDAARILKGLRGRVDRVQCTSVGGVRHRTAEELRGLAAVAGLEAVAAEPPEVAVANAVAQAGAGGWVLVTGSLHLAGAVRGVLAAAVPAGDPPCSPSARTSS